MSEWTSGWNGEPKSKLHRWFKRAGWTVQHCGHPTAHWPWAVLDPQGRLHTSGNGCNLGYAFRYMEDAKAHVDQHLAGELPPFKYVEPAPRPLRGRGSRGSR